MTRDDTKLISDAIKQSRGHIFTQTEMRIVNRTANYIAEWIKDLDPDFDQLEFEMAAGNPEPY